MEFRGDSVNEQSKSRPAITRRSCDQCRSRKIGCDRGTPCSNCMSARINCTHSAVASQTTSAKQRVLISSKYEQKIDEIAKGVDDLKGLLQSLNLDPEKFRDQIKSKVQLRNNIPTAPTGPSVRHHTDVTTCEPLWDHSVHIIDFLKVVIDDRNATDAASDTNDVVSSLKELVHALEGPTSLCNAAPTVIRPSIIKERPQMPPMEAAIETLRWAKKHEEFYRMGLFSRILPLETFTDICKKVYFAVDEYSDIEFLLANGYLAYIFAEYVIVRKTEEYKEYSLLCRDNFHNGFAQLPLLLQPSMELVALLTIGANSSIETSKGMMAWTLISNAANMCQTLGYHRQRPARGEADIALRTAQQNLFWSVYRLEKSLSVRFGRPSNIRDSDITLVLDEKNSQHIKQARIQGKVYEQLWSPTALSRSIKERTSMAEELAAELRALIDETRAGLIDATNHPDEDPEADPFKIVYKQCDLVCKSSLLTLILRAIPVPRGSMSGATDECIAVAREVLDVHQQCIHNVRNCESNPFMVTTYINWAILQTPFVPFSILFTRAIQRFDLDDLARLDRFTASLHPPRDAGPPESITHPYHLYELLTKAARLYIESNNANSSSSDSTATTLVHADFADVAAGDFDFSAFGMEGLDWVGDSAAGLFGMSDWYYENQQMMSLLDEDMMF